jgi:hypothetical protein
LRDPVFTGIWSDTMFGKPVGTTMTLRPFGSSFSVAGKVRRSGKAPVFFAGERFVAAAAGRSRERIARAAGIRIMRENSSRQAALPAA